MSFLPLDKLRAGSAELGIELSDRQLAQLDEFAALMVETNRKFNLTRITEPDEIVTGHYLDSFTCLAAHTPAPNASVIDVGTGAGFPGIPIAVARPDLAVTLLDSTRKKLDFLSRAVEHLGLGNIRLVRVRAEEIGRKPEHREDYDMVYARALAETKILAELCLPLARVGGHLIAQKSVEIDEELADAKAIIGQLGGVIERDVRIAIPGTEIVRRIVVIAKTKPTSNQFPRTFSRISGARR